MCIRDRHNLHVFHWVLAAVGAYGFYKGPNLLGYRFWPGPHHRPAVCVKAEGARDGEVGGATGTLNGGQGFTQVTHGLDKQKVSAALGQTSCLLGIGSGCFFASERTQRRQKQAGGSHVPRDKHAIPSFLTGKLGGEAVDLKYAIG
jgi:hypothetical protein